MKHGNECVAPYHMETKSQTCEIGKFCTTTFDCDFLKITLNAVRPHFLLGRCPMLDHPQMYYYNPKYFGILHPARAVRNVYSGHLWLFCVGAMLHQGMSGLSCTTR